MSPLIWDEIGTRTYQAGIDHGVLYIDGVASVWNGLVGVEDSTTGRSLPLYQEGIKYMEYQQQTEFEGTLTAFTYPDLFERALGIAEEVAGLNFHDQYPKAFNLSYRTMLGDDLIALSRGYMIHLLYNLYATPTKVAFATTSDLPNPTEFAWKLTSIPTQHTGRRPTAHLSINSTKMNPIKLANLENALYGLDGGAPYLPSIAAVVALTQ